MKITRRTSVIIETERKLVVSTGGSAEDSIDCGECAGQMLTTRTTARLLEISEREIYRLLEAGKIHFIETGQREIYVCLASVRQIFDLAE